MYSLEQTKRGLCPYDDKRYLLSDLPDGSPNPQTHAYGHKDLLQEETRLDDTPADPNAELNVEPYVRLTREQIAARVARREERMKRKHARVQRTVARIRNRDSNGEEIDEEDGFANGPEGNSDGELDDGEYERAKQVASARPGAQVRVGKVIERLCAVERLDRPSLPLPRLPLYLQPSRMFHAIQSTKLNNISRHVCTCSREAIQTS